MVDFHFYPDNILTELWVEGAFYNIAYIFWDMKHIFS